MMKMNGLLLAALTAASVLTSGCVVAPADPYYDRPVRVAPPPLRQEYPGYAPYADYLWVSGYWGWGGAHYEWVPGRWDAPRQGHVWVPHRWERDGDHWRQSGGRWEQDSHPRPASRMEPQPLPRQERDNPPRREWSGDSRESREVQLRSEPRTPPPVERESRSRYERQEGGRPVEVNPAARTDRGNGVRPESRPAPMAAPAVAPAAAPAPAPQRSQAQRDERARGEHKDDSRAKRRQPGDER
jgi:hypothetical protein